MLLNNLENKFNTQSYSDFTKTSPAIQIVKNNENLENINVFKYQFKNDNIKIDKYFAIGQSIGVKYDDEFLNIDWKIEKKFQILSDADEKLLSFNDVSSSFDYNTKLY